jgi:hypothetical protein
MNVREHLIAKLAKLGDNQITCLHYLQTMGPWPGYGWTWGSRSQTLRILESLVKRGYVTKTDRGEHKLALYRIAPGIYDKD